MRGFVAAVSQCQHRDDAGMDVGDVGDEKPCGTGDVDPPKQVMPSRLQSTTAALDPTAQPSVEAGA